jgi:GT2 family glycosyltransferase
LIKKESFLKVGGFDANVARTEDFDLWMRLLFYGTRIGYLRKILFRFRISPGSGSGDSIVRLERNGNVWRILQQKLNFTEEENRTIERHIGGADAAVLRAKGRLFIDRQKWAEAREMFREAEKKAAEFGLPLKHRLKMKLVIFLLGFSPSLLLKLFRSFRSEELEYMPNEVR